MSRSAHSALAPKSCSLLVAWVLLIGTPGVSLADPDHWVIDEDHFTYPEMHFRATEYDAEGGVLRGEFTLLGTTREIELDVSINRIDESPFESGGLFSDPPRVLGASLRGTIHRSEYGMTYALEDELVGDEVQIMLEFEAHRQD